MRNKVSLVLEGGGMRGAYTAGCLSWLIDQNLVFDEAFAISTGAVHLTSFLLKNKEALYKFPCVLLTDKNCVGIRALLKEGRYVAYDYVFDTLLEQREHFDVSPIKKHPTKIHIGLYELNKCQCEYFSNDKIQLKLLKAACSLPIVSKIVEEAGNKYLDGGITKMIPIEESINCGLDKHLVISTKHIGYVRKRSSKIVEFLMKLIYRKYPKMYDDYHIRAENFHHQMDIVENLVKEKKACLIRPTIKYKVKRFSGDPEALKKLYELGYRDMEAKKAEILSLFNS